MPRGRMLDVMERSAVEVWKRRGLNVAIGAILAWPWTTVAAAVEALDISRVRERRVGGRLGAHKSRRGSGTGHR